MIIHEYLRKSGKADKQFGICFENLATFQICPDSAKCSEKSADTHRMLEVSVDLVNTEIDDLKNKMFLVSSSLDKAENEPFSL